MRDVLRRDVVLGHAQDDVALGANLRERTLHQVDCMARGHRYVLGKQERLQREPGADGRMALARQAAVGIAEQALLVEARLQEGEVADLASLQLLLVLVVGPPQCLDAHAQHLPQHRRDQPGQDDALPAGDRRILSVRSDAFSSKPCSLYSDC